MRKDINEWDIDEIRPVFDRGILKCVPRKDLKCDDCAYHNGVTCDKRTPKCTPRTRKDNNYVKFIVIYAYNEDPLEPTKLTEGKCKQTSTKLNICLNSSQH